MLKVEKLTKKFNQNTAVNNVSFAIRPGEVFSLIGPNGSGKTTIIKTVAGLLRPSDGRVLISDFDISAEPERAKRLLGYIPDEPAVWSALTGEEFLRFTGALYGMKALEVNARIPKLLTIFNLGGIAGGFFEDYSRGNKQKFAILAALLHRPKLLLIDEPIVGLDPQSAEIAKGQFKKFAAEGGAVLLVTHTLSVAQEISDRIGVLAAGRLTYTGTLGELREAAKEQDSASLEKIYKVLT